MGWQTIFGLLKPKSRASLDLALKAAEAGLDGTLVIQLVDGKAEAFFTTGRAELVVR